MEVSELIKKVRRVEIKARGLSREIFSGQYHSAFKGRGMLFSEVREYQFGDDVRNIEWNVTARFGHPYVKVFEEERELSVLLVIDMSSSSHFGSQGPLKREIMAEICAILAFSAIQNNDKVGLVLFTGEVELFIPPRKGKIHVLRIIRELLDFEPKHTHTNLGIPLRFIANAIKKKCTAFLISDMMGPQLEEAIKITARKHDLIALRMLDPLEKDLPDAGLVYLTDPETGKAGLVDTSSRRIRQAYHEKMEAYHQRVKNIFTIYGIDSADILMGNDYVKPLNRLFRAREYKR